MSAPLLLCPDDNLCLFWNYDADNVYVQLIANTPGWFSVVVNPDRTTPLSGDMWLFDVSDTTGSVMAIDTWSNGQSNNSALLPSVCRLAFR
jgi:hypothetical protein